MSDLICKQTMSRCNTPGMCAPHGGCHIHVPPRSPREAIANMTEKDWELIGLRATVAQQAAMIEHLRGGPTPLYTAVDMANAARDERRGIADNLIERLATAFPDSEAMMTVECFADWLSREIKP